MSSFAYDKEVEKYLGFLGVSCKNNFTRNCSVTPGRLKTNEKTPQTGIKIKRPSSACDFVAVSKTPYKNEFLLKTPKKTIISSSRKKTPCSQIRTPCKTSNCDSDRFIPSRNQAHLLESHHRIIKFHDSSDLEHTKNSINDKSIRNQENRKYKQSLSENFCQLLGDVNEKKILQFCSPVKKTPSKVSTCSSANSSKRKKLRYIPQSAERILDAPNYLNDYYLNLLHWSTSIDLVAVALEQSVYIWTPLTGDISHLCQLNESGDYVSSVQWVEEGPTIAIGTASGAIQIWDINHKKRIRQMVAHSSRIGVLSWRSHILTSGCRSGSIYNHDVRIAEHHISSYFSHQQEVCGLQWSQNGRYLASGCNSNMLLVWDFNAVGRPEPLHRFNQHQAAVKAVSWCPWQQQILASGGGAADKCIRFWNINSGSCLNTVETESQVSSILWNEEYRELISGHGHPNNQLTIWEYPSMRRQINLLGHSSRVLQLTMSPDHTKVMSAAGDETLRLWSCFQTSNAGVNKKSKPTPSESILSMTQIR